MKITLLALSLLITLASLPALAAHKEIRGGWVSAWMKGYFTPEEADATIAAARRAKLNALFIQVRKTADAYYDSSIEPRGQNIAPGYDPLAYVIEKAHAQGIEVHAWVNVCRVWIGKSLPEDSNHLVHMHADWLNRDYKGKTTASDGMFIDPGVPEARAYVVNVIRDIAKRYDVDGIHLDYIRYPGADWGYSETALSRYRAFSGTRGKPDAANWKWSEWRRSQVTELVKEIRVAVKAVKPKAQLSAATIAWGNCPSAYSSSLSHVRVYQDWKNWLARGLVDINMPMNYRCDSTSTGSSQFRGWLRGYQEWSADKPTYVGLDVYNNKPEGILRQIEAVRKANLPGFVLFSFNESTARDALVAALRDK